MEDKNKTKDDSSAGAKNSRDSNSGDFLQVRLPNSLRRSDSSLDQLIKSLDSRTSSESVSPRSNTTFQSLRLSQVTYPKREEGAKSPRIGSYRPPASNSNSVKNCPRVRIAS